jgi:hypothetical protein
MRRVTLILFLTLLNSIVFSQRLPGNFLYRCNEKLVEIIMEDLFTPPVASRVQLYPNVAAYEVLAHKHPKLRSLGGQLKGLTTVNAPASKIDHSLAAFFAFTTVAKRLVYSEYLIEDFQKKESANWLSLNKDSVVLQQSIEYGQQVADHIIAWLKADNYDYTRTLTRYIVVDSAGAWQPTAPDYANAIEPNWHYMRSTVFDSLNRVHAIPPLRYDEKKHSAFYKSAMKVYEQSIKSDTLHREIALFWDCNPNITRSAGHFTYFIHKVSPGGHWLRIAGQALKNLGMDEISSAKTYTLVSLALFEGFLSCWTDKFQYNTLRPETYINKLISPKWKPYIETPPFPEYPSGHSVISSASATVLTAMIPQPYSFTDSSEMYINLPPRRFESFRDAVNEASLSRFYGGIHFMEALDNGIDLGKRVGNFLLQKLKLEND